MNLDTVNLLNIRANLIVMSENIKAFAASPKNLFQTPLLQSDPVTNKIPPNWHYFILPNIPVVFRLVTEYEPNKHPISIGYIRPEAETEIISLTGLFVSTVAEPTEQQILKLSTALNQPTNKMSRLIQLFNQHTAV